MGSLLDPNFWTGQVATALQAWAVVVPLLIIAAVIAWRARGAIDEGEVRGVRSHKDWAEAQVQQLQKQDTDNAARRKDLLSEINELRRQLSAAQPRKKEIEPILKKIESDTGALVESNKLSTTTINSLLGKYFVVIDEAHEFFASDKDDPKATGGSG